jgi:hypothetical protein
MFQMIYDYKDTPAFNFIMKHLDEEILRYKELEISIPKCVSKDNIKRFIVNNRLIQRELFDISGRLMVLRNLSDKGQNVRIELIFVGDSLRSIVDDIKVEIFTREFSEVIKNL